MSRAMRRHPVASPKAGKRAQPIVRPGGGKRPPRQREPQGGPGVSGLLSPQWATDIVSELRKVTWPSRDDTWYLTLVVLVVAIAFGVFLGGVDMFFNWAIDRTIIP